MLSKGRAATTPAYAYSLHITTALRCLADKTQKLFDVA
jgi:hypothetical protein